MKKSGLEDKRVPGEESPCFPSTVVIVNVKWVHIAHQSRCSERLSRMYIVHAMSLSTHCIENHNILETEKNCIKSFFCQLNGKIATKTWGNDLVKFLKGIFPYSPTIFLVICQPLIDCIWRPTWRLKRANHPFCRRLGRYQKLRSLNLSALGSARTLITRFMT